MQWQALRLRALAAAAMIASAPQPALAQATGQAPLGPSPFDNARAGEDYSYPRNLLNLHPLPGVDLGNGRSLYGAAVFYWRESLGDGMYDNPGNLIRASDGSRAHYVGTQGEVVLEWDSVRGLSFQAAYSLFEPGPFIEETGPSKTVHYVGTEVQLRF